MYKNEKTIEEEQNKSKKTIFFKKLQILKNNARLNKQTNKQ